MTNIQNFSDDELEAEIERLLEEKEKRKWIHKDINPIRGHVLKLDLRPGTLLKATIGGVVSEIEPEHAKELTAWLSKAFPAPQQPQIDLSDIDWELIDTSSTKTLSFINAYYLEELRKIAERVRPARSST